MHDVWNGSGTDTDGEMNLPPRRVDLTPLCPYEDAYLAEVRRALLPFWRRRPLRRR